MKYFFTFIFILTNQLSFAQDNCPKYDTYIAKGDSCFYKLKDETKYNLAINAYSAAMLHCPQKAAEARLRIKAVFDTIQNLRLEADKNFREAKNATKRAEDSTKAAKRERESAQSEKMRADSSEKIAKDALKISDANNLMYEAQGMVKYDPTLALHLANTAIDSVKTIISLNKKDSLIFDKANRIFYENNFYNTIISKLQNDTTGTILKAVYLKQSNNICAITDAAYAIIYDQNGDLKKAIKLDSAYTQYDFKVSGVGTILVHGTKPNELSYGKIWDIETNQPPVLIDTFSFLPYFNKKDSILLNSSRDTTMGWVNRLFEFGYKAFQLNNRNKYVPVISGVFKEIRLVAFSKDGHYMAINDGTRSIKLIDIKGNILDSIRNTGDVPKSIEFSSDNKVLFVEQPNKLQLYTITHSDGGPKLTDKVFQTIYSGTSTLQNFRFSRNGKRILLSLTEGGQQIIWLYEKDSTSEEFKLYSTFKCPGSKFTYAVFSKDESGILSTSNNIRFWKIPQEPSEGWPIEKTTEFITSVQYDTAAALIHAFTFSNRRQNYFLDGNFFNYSDTFHSEEISTRLAAFLPNKKTLMVSEDGILVMYNEKELFQEYIKKFKFDEFTNVQKKIFFRK